MKMKKLASWTAVLVAVGVVAFYGNRTESEASGVVASAALPTAAPAVVPCAVTSSAPGAPLFVVASNQTATVRGTKPYVLTCATRVGKSLRLAAEAMGARTTGVLSSRTLLVEADVATCRRLRADRRFESVSEFLPTDKIAKELASRLAAGEKTVEVGLMTLSSEDRLAVQSRIVAGGGEILTGCLNEGSVFRARVSADQVADLAACGDVRWMESFVRPQLMNDRAVEPAAMNVKDFWLSEENPGGLSGAGQFVTTSDSGIDTGDVETMHEDLADRIAGISVVDGCAPHDGIGHGTHTAGSIVGNGKKSDGKIRGVAWGAMLYAWFCGKDGSGSIYTPDSLDDLYRPDQENCPAYLHSASWGSSAKGEYTSECQANDAWTWEHADYLPVYSAGNDGAGAGTIGSPAAAKNVLAVGATQNVRTHYPLNDHPTGDPTKMAGFSSRGPCLDGRIKPDVSAPGVGILSTRAYAQKYNRGESEDGHYAYECGTSMSCPLVAGSVALVREWLMKREEFTDEEPPTAALMKAIVTGGAKNRAVPDTDMGWGCVDIGETLYPTNGRAVALFDRIPFAEDETFSWIVETTNEAPLDVQLVWVDAPGTPSNSSEPLLVNDLDLSVEEADDATGEVLYGNGGTSPDQLNNVESVRLAGAKAKKYRISVTCSSITYDYEEGGAAALYIRGAFDPEEIKNDSARVRIMDAGAEIGAYVSLDAALKKVKDGQTVEILAPAKLRRSCELSASCTIVATNAVPSASPVGCLNDATLFVTNGTVFFSNVVFTAGSAAPVTAVAPARVRVAGTAWFGEITSETPGIAYDSPSCFVLGGELENAIVLSCPAAPGADCKFGVYDCAATVATNAARRLLCAGDVELAGRVDAGDLRWESDAPVDPLAAVAYAVGADPAGNVYYRSLDKLLDQHHENVRVAVARPDVSLEKTHVLANVEICGEGDEAGVSAGPSAGLKVTNGELTVSGLTFADYTGDGLLVADGSGASLTVSNAVFSGIEGTNYHSGAVVSLGGAAVTVGGGVTFSNCRASGVHKVRVLNFWKEKTVQSYGGAIYVGPGGTLALDATDGPISITDCSAASGGGGIYAKDAMVSVAGDLTVRGNWRDVNVSDDLWLPDSGLCCTGDLTSAPQSVGVFSGAKGDVFATRAVGVTAAKTRKAFFCDSDATLAAVFDGASNLVWSDVVDSRVETKAEAVCGISGGGEASNGYYATLEDAFAALVDGATLTLFADAEFVRDMFVSNKVTVVSEDASAPVAVSSLGKARIFVVGDGSVTLKDVVFDGQFGEGGLFKVDGGSLTLTAGATVCNVLGTEGRGSGAVHVYNGGSVTMKSGSEIADCWNVFDDSGSGGCYGGALLVEDSSKADLLGGRICGCCAYAAGGVFVGTKSTVRLAGDMTILGNADVDGLESNLYVSDDSDLILTGASAFSGAIGLTTGYQADTNVFGRIENLAGDIQAAAHAFTNDVTHDVGMAVTNGTEKLLVWSSALDAAGQYVDANGKKYELADGAPTELVEPQVETELVYDGTEKVGLKEGIGYVRTSGYLGTNAGPYQATATLRPGFVWMSPDAPNVWTGSWAIAQCTLTITNYVTFTDAKYVYDEQPKTIAIDGVLPAGVRVAYFDAANNPWPEKGVWQVGSYEITAKFTCDDPNYVLDQTELKATLTIEKGSEPPDPPPGPDPVQPDPIAFKSIEKIGETTWALVITNRVPFCNYRLLYTDDLSKGFVHTGAWEQAAADADPVWTTNVVIEGVNWFWKAEAKEGVKQQ